VIKQSVPFPGMVADLLTIGHPGVPAGGHAYVSTEKSWGRRRGGQISPETLGNKLTNVKLRVLFVWDGAGRSESCLEEVHMSNCWPGLSFLCTELNRLMFHTKHQFFLLFPFGWC
jgi:hypothetical protein